MAATRIEVAWSAIPVATNAFAKVGKITWMDCSVVRH